MALEPIDRNSRDSFQSAGLFEEVSGAGHDFQFRFLANAPQMLESGFVHSNHLAILLSAHNQKGGRANGAQRLFPHQIWAPATRHHRLNRKILKLLETKNCILYAKAIKKAQSWKIKI